METSEKIKITVGASVKAPVEKVWARWTEPKHIIRWNAASEDWHTTYAENDLRVGGKFLSRMEAKDGGMGFDFSGEYIKVEPFSAIEYALGDGRKVAIAFSTNGDLTEITETFEAETTNSAEMQKAGWQAIMDNFRKYVENDKLEILQFEVTIPAPVEKVFKNMLDEKPYAAWTSVFNADSHYVGSWKKGSKILFLGTGESGKVEGMVARVKENIANKYVSIEHLGLYDGEKEIVDGPEAEGWAGALENYLFAEKDGQTVVKVDLDVNRQFKSYFEEAWPKALEKLKAICVSD